MADSELTITVDRSPNAPNITDKIETAREAVRQRSEQVEDISKTLHKSEAPLTLEDSEPVEDVESIELTLPNGLEIVFGPPAGISLTMRMAMFFNGTEPSQLTLSLYRILFCIKSVNGRAVPPLTDTIQAQKLANQIGDDGLDILATVNQRYWKPLKISQLPAIKKNLR